MSLIIAAAAFLFAGRTNGLAGRSVRTRLLALAAATFVTGLLARWLVDLDEGPAVLRTLVALLLVLVEKVESRSNIVPALLGASKFRLVALSTGTFLLALACELAGHVFLVSP